MTYGQQKSPAIIAAGRTRPHQKEISATAPTAPAQSASLSVVVKISVQDSRRMFRLGKPATPTQWIGHIVLALVALFLVWWMFRVYVL
jgi:hypothetical protein